MSTLTRLELALYPQLREFSAAEQLSALERAREGELKSGEWTILLLALGLAAGLSRDLVWRTGLDEVLGAAMANLVVSFALVALLVGPVMVRRTRRLLARQLLEKDPVAPHES